MSGLIRLIAVQVLCAAALTGQWVTPAHADPVAIGSSDWVIDIPADFRPMTPVEVSVKYPASRMRDSGFYTLDDTLGVTIGIEEFPIPQGAETLTLDEAGLEEFFQGVSIGVTRAGLPAVSLIESTLITIDGETWGQLEMKIDTPGSGSVGIYMIHVTDSALLAVQANAVVERWTTHRHELLDMLHGLTRG